MLTIEDVNSMIDTWIVKYPRHAIRWSGITGDSAYKFKCPGWVVMVASRAWKERWDALPGPKLPELSEREFQEFFDEWARHIQAFSVTRDLDPCP